MRRKSPLGVAGTSALGTAVMVAKRDPDIVALLAPFIRDLGPA